MNIPMDNTPVTDRDRNEAISIYCAAALDFLADSCEDNFYVLRWAAGEAEKLGVLEMAHEAFKSGEWSPVNTRVN